MNIHTQIRHLKAQITQTEQLYEMVKNHRLMGPSMSSRLSQLREQLAELPTEQSEPKVQLLFNGNAVLGSSGIKAVFLSKILAPFQEMVKTQMTIKKHGKVGKRGPSRQIPNSDLYLTALPVGSFGVELRQLEADDLFSSQDFSEAIHDVMQIIQNTASDDQAFERTIESIPKRNLNHLKNFLGSIANEQSLLKMVSGHLNFELASEKVAEAHSRVASTNDEESESEIEGVLRGVLLDSSKFEFKDTESKLYVGFIGENLDDDQLIGFLNKQCIVKLKIYTTTFSNTGKQTTSYELIEIEEIRSV